MTPQTPITIALCKACGNAGPFSANQKRKKELRLCVHCAGQLGAHKCATCGLSFHDANSLLFHSLSHRDRAVSPPTRVLTALIGVPGPPSIPLTKQRKQDGRHECSDGSYKCKECDQSFFDEHSLQWHCQHKHRMRNYLCTGCCKSYCSHLDVILHFESGACSACPGADNAFRDLCRQIHMQPGGERFLLPRIPSISSSDSHAARHRLQCPHCVRTFERVSALCQHLSTNPECRRSGAVPSLFVGPIPKTVQVKLFHGTSLRRALQIEKDGFHVSAGGYLGPGVYCADKEKAIGYAIRRTAMDPQTRRDAMGGLLELVVRAHKVKYTPAEDREWQSQGYDACRSDRTTQSHKMEWCIKCPRQITVLHVYKLPI